MATTPTAMPRFRVYSRRGFLAAAGGVAAWSVTIVPRRVLGGPGHLPPSERVRVAGIGAGGMGGGDIATHAKNGADIVAVCDVEPAAPPAPSRPFPRRRVTRTSAGCSTTSRSGSTPSPLARLTHPRRRHGRRNSGGQARLLPKAAYAHACGMPNGHTGCPCRWRDDADGQSGARYGGRRLTNEWIQAGVIGEIREVHSWCGGAPSFDNPYRRDRPGGKPPRGAAESRWTTTPHHIRTILLPMLSGGLQFLPRSKSLATLSTTWVPGDRHDVGQIVPSATTDRYHRSKAEKARITPGLPT